MLRTTQSEPVICVSPKTELTKIIQTTAYDVCQKTSRDINEDDIRKNLERILNVIERVQNRGGKINKEILETIITLHQFPETFAYKFKKELSMMLINE